jgi:hypothetical protein
MRYLEAVLWSVGLAGSIVALLFVHLGERDGRGGRRRRGYVVALIVVLLISVIGAAWLEVALRSFAEREGGSVRGLIANPTGTNDHQFTQNGRQYLYWAFQVPLVTTAVALVLGSVLASGILFELGYRRTIFGIWAWAFAVGAGLSAFAFLRFIQAVNLFV